MVFGQSPSNSRIQVNGNYALMPNNSVSTKAHQNTTTGENVSAKNTSFINSVGKQVLLASDASNGQL